MSELFDIYLIFLTHSDADLIRPCINIKICIKYIFQFQNEVNHVMVAG